MSTELNYIYLNNEFIVIIGTNQLNYKLVFLDTHFAQNFVQLAKINRISKIHS